ncbi:hypothetical protein GCM10010246_78440 [Streptomyces cuspidosporus]|uniref:Uncharacterized protein n=1 Tax=Streptomyces cuspidosporus TaxID=66882 RepID=A0ABN3H8H9_9ACTN
MTRRPGRGLLGGALPDRDLPNRDLPGGGLPGGGLVARLPQPVEPLP